MIRLVIPEDAEIYLDSVCGPQDSGTSVELRTCEDAGIANQPIIKLVFTDNTIRKLQHELNDQFSEVSPNRASDKILELIQALRNDYARDLKASFASNLQLLTNVANNMRN